MDFEVKLLTVQNASLFVTVCSTYKDVEIDYIAGRYNIDAKSLMGVLSIGLERTCRVRIKTDNQEVIEKFKEDISLWRA